MRFVQQSLSKVETPRNSDLADIGANRSESPLSALCLELGQKPAEIPRCGERQKSPAKLISV